MKNTKIKKENKISKKKSLKQDEKILSEKFEKLAEAHKELFIHIVKTSKSPMQAAGLMHHILSILMKAEFDFLTGIMRPTKDAKEK